MSLHHSILGFLSSEPMTRPTLKGVFDWSVGYFWTTDQADFCRTLLRLQEAGLVEVASQQPADQDPTDPVYQVTRRGQSVLEDWLPSPEEFYPVREPFLLRLFFAAELDHDIVDKLLADHIGVVADQLAALEKIAAEVGIQQIPRHDIGLSDRLRLATLENGIARTKAELDWAQSLWDELYSKRDKPGRAS